MKDKGFVVSVGPHIQSGVSLEGIFTTFSMAILPALVVAVYFLKMQAIKVIVVSVVAAVVIDAFLQWLFKKEINLKNPYAIFTGLLFAAIMPVTMPWWGICAGLFMGLLVGLYVYGGVGSNPFNPVLVGWAILKLSYPGYMDMSSSILGVLKLEGIGAIIEDYSYLSESYGIEEFNTLGAKFKLLLKFLLQWKTGAWSDELVLYTGSICALALIIGGLFLIWRRYASWHAPVGFLLTVFCFSVIFYKGDRSYLFPYLLIQLLAGSTLITAFFLVTDPVTTPVTNAGMFVFGVLAALVMMLGRLWGKWIDPGFFGVLVANAFTPLIDRIVKPKPFGRFTTVAK